jgi:KipI family sensor histidine kinase inhibitor
MVPAGDTALLVELGEGIDETVNRAVHRLAVALGRQALAGVLDVIPTYRSLLVCYDPLCLPLDALQEAIARLVDTLADIDLPPPRTVDIPTCYGGAYGPDLAFVGQHNHLSPDEVVAIHTGTSCTVYMMGFSPGFVYLGGMSPRIATPRLSTPRTSIPAGSVGIAGGQTGIYPVQSPGGWQLIGRTPVTLFDAGRTPPTLVEPGDVIRFVPIDAQRYEELEAGSPATRDATVRGEPVEPRRTGHA